MGYARWFEQPLSNAHLASVATYHDFVLGFRVLLRQEQDFPAFFRMVRELADLPKSERHQRLAALGETTPRLATIEP